MGCVGYPGSAEVVNMQPSDKLIKQGITDEFIKPLKKENNIYDGIIIAVAHEKFKKLGHAKIINLCKL